MGESILGTIKAMLGIDVNDTAFDSELINHINATLMTLNQLGLGKSTGLRISGSGNTWAEFYGYTTSSPIYDVTSYVFLKVKTLFDPPSSSFVLEAMDRQAKEYEWRLNVFVDHRPVVTIPTEVDDG